ncbi:MAG: DUF4391 domain-containing protein [Bacteriovoracales bacterium]|nr:DUF4391 domain-containing protein [Bacteriovoracales bacterium]
MNFLYAFPQASRYGKKLPKSKIYQHTSPSSKVKGLFSREIEKITWSWKLSPETVNIPATERVQEIQVLTLSLKTPSLKRDILRTIDKAIPSPILFHLDYEERGRYTAAYKRPSGADKKKWVVGNYFETPWIRNRAEAKSLPIALDMETLYREILGNLIPIPYGKSESLEEWVSRAGQVCAMQKKAKKLENKMKKEIQFNKKLELYRQLKEIKRGVEALSS